MSAYPSISWGIEMARDPMLSKRAKRPASKPEPGRRGRVKRFAQLQRDLRTNEERWQAVINNPFIGITVIDQNHRFIMTNSAFQNMVGYKDEELKELTPLDITPEGGQREMNRVLFAELQQGGHHHFKQMKQWQQ